MNKTADDAVREAGMQEEAGEIERAIEVLSHAIEHAPDDARLRAQRGRLFHLRKHWEEAVRDFDVALSIRPRAATTLFFRARARSMLNDVDGALMDFKACLATQPQSADALYEIALIHEYRGELARAVQTLKEANLAAGGDFRDTNERISELQKRLSIRK